MVVFTIENIKNAIWPLKHSNFPVPDGIPSSLPKQGGADIPLLLLKIFTLSLTSGIYPQIWKTSIIAPERKRNNNNEISNFRPINITSVMSRLTEKVISAEISSHIHKHKLLINSQHEFTKNRSTMSCQFDFLNHITTCRDTGYNVIYRIEARISNLTQILHFGISVVQFELSITSKYWIYYPCHTVIEPIPSTQPSTKYYPLELQKITVFMQACD